MLTPHDSPREDNVTVVGRKTFYEGQHPIAAIPLTGAIRALLKPSDQVHHQLRLHAFYQGRQQLVHHRLRNTRFKCHKIRIRRQKKSFGG